MKNLSKILASISLLFFLSMVSVHAQSENRVTRGQPPLNPKWTVIIDYVDSFDGHKPRHQPRDEPPAEECPPEDLHCPNNHFELMGGVWPDSTPGDGVVDPALSFLIDLRGFPAGSANAIQNAFNAWEAETTGNLVPNIFWQDVDLGFGDDVNTYSMRNLGRGVLAATFITWSDLDNNSEINDGEPLLEMDVIHNFTVKWGTDEFTPNGRWWDVQNVATHELGHVFGLTHPNGHERDKLQTMFATSQSKETGKRTLEADGDIPGINSSFLGY